MISKKQFQKEYEKIADVMYSDFRIESPLSDETKMLEDHYITTDEYKKVWDDYISKIYKLFN